MKLNILCDANWESRLDSVLKDLSATDYRNLFNARNYGQGLIEVVVVLMCRNPRLNFKQRIRFAKKKMALSLDIMLDLDQMQKADDNTRRRIVIDRLTDELPVVLRKYSIPDFDETRFIDDLRSWLNGIV
jgi:hypothetical protein